jgi:hypothetical protein
LNGGFIAHHTDPVVGQVAQAVDFLVNPLAGKYPGGARQDGPHPDEFALTGGFARRAGAVLRYHCAKEPKQPVQPSILSVKLAHGPRK